MKTGSEARKINKNNMKKPTNKELEQRALIAEQNSKDWADADTKRREHFSELLGSYEEQSGYGSRSRSVIVLPWLQIAFRMGQLKANSENNSLAHQRDELRSLLGDANNKIAAMIEFHKRQNGGKSCPLGGCPQC